MSDLMPILTAVLYLRMSSDQQDTSIKQQREQLYAYFAKRYRIVREYTDEGKSGSKKTEKRTAFLQMLSDVKLGHFQVILCLNLDRFGRLNSIQSGQYAQPLFDHGVIIDTVLDGTTDLSTSEGRMIFSIRCEQGNAYSVTLAQKILKGRVDAVSRGEWVNGVPPYGMSRLIIDAKGNTTIVPRAERFRKPKGWTVKLCPGEPGEVDLTRWIFKDFAERGLPYREYARQLNAKGVKSPTGGAWGGRTLLEILRNRAYIGEAVIGRRKTGAHYRLKAGTPEKVKGKPANTQSAFGEVVGVPNAWEGIIAPELFTQVQDVLARKKGTKAKGQRCYPLNGIIHCGKCGQKMYGKKDKKSGKIYYMCQTASRLPGQCRFWLVHEDEMLAWTIREIKETLGEKRLALKEAVYSPEVSDELATVQGQLDTLEAQLKTARKRYLDAPERIAAGLLDALTELEANKTCLTNRLDELVNQQCDFNAEFDRWEKWIEEVFDHCYVVGMKTIDWGEPDGTLFSGKVRVEIRVEPWTLRQSLLDLGAKVRVWFRQTPEVKRKRTDRKYSIERTKLEFTLRKSDSDVSDTDDSDTHIRVEKWFSFSAV